MTVTTYARHQDVPVIARPWPNFSPAEIACRGTARIRIDEDALDKLQALRDALGKPLIIRSPSRSRCSRSPPVRRQILGRSRPTPARRWSTTAGLSKRAWSETWTRCWTTP